MAQRVVVHLIDDLDGKTTADETVKFGLDGAEYEIDLSKKNADRLRSAVAAFAAAARKAPRGNSGRGVAGKRSNQGTGPAVIAREQNQAMREWAKKKGITVSERGRVPAAVQEQYHAETKA